MYIKISQMLYIIAAMGAVGLAVSTYTKVIPINGVFLIILLSDLFFWWLAYKSEKGGN